MAYPESLLSLMQQKIELPEDLIQGKELKQPSYKNSSADKAAPPNGE